MVVKLAHLWISAGKLYSIASFGGDPGEILVQGLNVPKVPKYFPLSVQIRTLPSELQLYKKNYKCSKIVKI